MDAKKLQQFQQQQQQQQQQQKKVPLAYQANNNDYRTTTHSPVFQQQQQHQQYQQQQQHTQLQHQLQQKQQHQLNQQQQKYQMHNLSAAYNQSPASASNSSGGLLSPIDIQPHGNKLPTKHSLNNTPISPQHSISSYQQQQQQYVGEQIYQSSPEKHYQSSPEQTYLSSNSHLRGTSPRRHPSRLQQQYQQLQQAKLQIQLQTQAEAIQRQQRTFALRQQINPPVPRGHYHMNQSSGLMATMAAQQQQQSPITHQRAPPSTLNLSSQFQPAGGPLKVPNTHQQKSNGQQQHQQVLYQQQEQNIYAQQQQQLQLQLQLQHQQQLHQQPPKQLQQQQHQRLKIELQTPGGTEQSPVYIQQNHPAHVVNQACQTQISAVKTNQTSTTPTGTSASKTPSSEDSTNKSLPHAPLDRKKSAGSIQALKSPTTKRPATSSVTMSGWLYKQGSEGLKVWRKRWFVLAEYCLYYYKGPEEEKLLGSILLPSYRVAACLPQDKIYRKYAFKCEHLNMRTYWLAAETAESMVQWVRALTAATMMQAPSSGESDQTSQPSAASSLNHSGENSDSGIHTLQSQQSKMSLNQVPVTPASEHANMQSTCNSGNSGGGAGGAQPLYANAPPKPRRITDGGYSSPSPEHSMDNEGNKQQSQSQTLHQHQSSRVMSPSLQQQQQYQQQQQQQQLRSQQHHAIYDTRTGNVTSTLRLQQQQQHQLDTLDMQLQQQLQLNDSNYVKSPAAASNAQQLIDMEDKIMRLQQEQQQQRTGASEDLFGERELYMQKLIQNRQLVSLHSTANTERRTPDAYGRSKNRLFSDYEDIYNFNQVSSTMPDATAASYRRPLSPPSYESNKQMPSIPNNLEEMGQTSMVSPSFVATSNTPSVRSATATIVRPHSADFLEYENHSVATNAATAPACTDVSPDQTYGATLRAQRPKSSLDINRTSDSLYYSEASYAEKMRKSSLYLQHPQTKTNSASTNSQHQNPNALYRPGAMDVYNTVGGMNTISHENPYERVCKRNELLSENQGAASMPRMSRSMGGTSQHSAAVRSASMHPHHYSQQRDNEQQDILDPQEQYKQKPYYKSPTSPSATTTSAQQQYLHQQQQRNEQFLRSASARLPKRDGYDDEYVMGDLSNAAPTKQITPSAILSHQEGERKREESMKRLLEWKQRMLQSPLTRKGVQQTVAGGPGSNMTAMSKLGSNPNMLLGSSVATTGGGGAHRGLGKSAGGNTLVGGVGGIQRSRSETQTNVRSGVTGGAGYNSYSSDDEASISVRNVRNLPNSNLSVKPESTDSANRQPPVPEKTLESYDAQIHNITNSYYATNPPSDTKYAKTKILSEKIDGSLSNYVGDKMLASSTPLHLPGHNHIENAYYGITTEESVNAVRGEANELPLLEGGGVSGDGGLSGSNFYDNQHSGYQSQIYQPLRRVGSRAEIDLLERETSTQMKNLDVSAGDLLSRTHEELVLLLIQLRRQNTSTARAIEQCCTDIHETQNCLRTSEGLSRAESIQRLDYLKQHLLDLERQYEKSKPLVNLVDNMVKLGSLYRNSNDTATTTATQGQQKFQLQQQQYSQHQYPQHTPQSQEALAFDRLEFNQRIQEQRLLQEEQKQWDRLSPNQNELQSKVQQLYYLDQLLQEESGTLQSLQRDKEDLERALGGIRARIQDTSGQPLALEVARKQQHMLERELSRVHQLLAENSKKLEQTVAGNARLEQELLVLRQKLQISRNVRNSHGVFISETYTNNTAAMLESELKRVQTLVGDMQRQRQELSAAVRQLTENSNRLYQEIGSKHNISAAPFPLDSSGGLVKKRSSSLCWIETDLDSMMSVDRALSDSKINLSTPLFVDTSNSLQHESSSSFLLNGSGSKNYNDYDGLDENLPNEAKGRDRQGDRSLYGSYTGDSGDHLETSGVDSDGFLETNPFAAMMNQEKQEIKTVRIVKRESERRQRDRERIGLSNSSQNLDQVLEEEQQLALLQSGNSGTASYQVENGYDEDFQMAISSDSSGRSKSLPRQCHSERETPKTRHHRHHHHQSSRHSSQSTAKRFESQTNYEDYYANVTDKNSNYSNRVQNLTNGTASRGEHLNPLATAYFAKQQAQYSHLRSSTQSAALRQKTESVSSLNRSLTDLTPAPIFQSEAARQIISELSAGSASEDTEKVVEKVPSQHKHRRAVPREKRRHYTAPNNVNVKAMENIQAENDMNRNNTNWRARDDLDMEVTLRPRMNAPDVVRSALGHGEKISENTIDNLLLAPNKILIPERYIPEKAPELSPEEKKRRQEKVESIKKMLAETPISSANDNSVSVPPSKMNAEKKQREHLLQLNQILAQQVMQMSKIVAGNPSNSSNPK